jgi:hypothetical protein
MQLSLRTLVSRAFDAADRLIIRTLKLSAGRVEERVLAKMGRRARRRMGQFLVSQFGWWFNQCWVVRSARELFRQRDTGYRCWPRQRIDDAGRDNLLAGLFRS